MTDTVAIQDRIGELCHQFRLPTAARLPAGKTWETSEHDRVPLSLRGCVTKLESGWFQSFEHQVDHRYMDPGLAGFGQFPVVFAESSAPGQQGQCALYYPTAGQYLEVVAVRTATHHLQQPSASRPSPRDQLTGISGVSPDDLEPRNRPSSLASTSLAPSRSWILAACTTTARSNPVVSTTMWRLRPDTLLPAS